MNDWHRILQRFMHREAAQRLFRQRRPILVVLLVIAINISLIGCGGSPGDRTTSGRSSARSGIPKTLQEVAPPANVQALAKEFDVEPKVRITSPRADETLQDDRVTVRFRVTELPIFKDDALQLGPHLQVLLDNEPYREVYNPDEPLVLEDLAPGTHTIRAFASRPWHESFKNTDAYDQVQFHVFTQTPSPDLDTPLLTYSSPTGAYGTEPILLDPYLTNMPQHSVTQGEVVTDVADWSVRCTINGQAFTFDDWEPIYLKGLKPGKNWVQLELLDNDGVPINDVYNNTARLITITPGGNDTLSKLMRDELPLEEARPMIISGYKPPVAVPETQPQTDEPTKTNISPPNEIEAADSGSDLTIDPPEPVRLPKTDALPPGLLIEETLPEIAPAAVDAAPEAAVNPDLESNPVPAEANTGQPAASVTADEEVAAEPDAVEDDNIEARPEMPFSEPAVQ